MTSSFYPRASFSGTSYKQSNSSRDAYDYLADVLYAAEPSVSHVQVAEVDTHPSSLSPWPRRSSLAMQDQHSMDSDIRCELLSRAAVLQSRYKALSRQADLQSAIDDYSAVLYAVPADSFDFPACQALLCNALCLYYVRWGGDDLLEEAMFLGEESIANRPARDIHYSSLLHVYGKALCLRGRHVSQRENVGKAVMHLRLARELAKGATARQACISIDYSNALVLQFVNKLDVPALEEAITVLRHAPISGRSAKLLAHSYLSCAVGLRYDIFHQDADLQEAMDLAQTVVRASSDVDFQRSFYLFTHSLALGKALDDDQALKLSVERAREAVRLSSGGEINVPLYYLTLSTQLLKFLDYANLDEAAQAAETATQLSFEGDVYHYTILGSLARVRGFQFYRTGRLQYLDEAIAALQHSADSAPKEHMHRVHTLVNLADELSLRYYHLGEPMDRVRAIDILDHCFASASNCHPLLLSQAAHTTNQLYYRSCESADLERAHGYVTQVRAHKTPYTSAALFLSLSGTITSRRAELSNRAEEWDEAINDLHRGLERPSGADPYILRRLGYALRKRFEIRRRVGDIDESVVVLKKATAVPFRWGVGYTLLGEALETRFRWYGHQVDLDAALSAFQRGTMDELGDLRYRFPAALSWAWLALDTGRFETALEGYGVAIRMLPRLAWLGNGTDRRLEELKGKAAGLSADAAAVAITTGKAEKAVELLEEGRAVFWQDSFRLRADVDALRSVAPAIAEELEDLGRFLENSDIKEAREEVEKFAQRQRRMAERWDALVEEVRQIDGFDDFLRPLHFDDLRCAADGGPVVILNASSLGCDALIVTAARPILHCPLGGMTAKSATFLSDRLTNALKLPRDRSASKYVEDLLKYVLDVLWHTVGKPIQEALDRLYPLGNLRRIYLCPTGPFCLLPLHAARPSDPSQPGLSDRYVCSYTATLSVLIRARGSWSRGQEHPRHQRLLAVSQSETLDHAPLKCAVMEMEEIQRLRLPLAPTFLDGDLATVERVCEQLQVHNFVHFTCHGISNTEDPFKSCLSLADGPLDLSRISKLRLPRADFAFLSACHTAKGLGMLPDENLHIASGLQLAGYLSIVATLWCIADKDAPLVTKIVYSYLTREGRPPDHTEAANALHEAMKVLRDSGVPASRWVPFVHIGI